MEAAFAQLLVEYCLEAQEGETILVEAEVPALRLLPHLKRAFLKRGAYPVFRIGYPGEGRDFLLYGGAWLERIPEVERALYEKADKFLRILSAENPLEGASLDPPDLLARFPTNAERVEARKEVVEAISQVLKIQPRAHWLERFREKGIPAAPVNDLAEAFQDPQAQARGAIWTLTHPLLEA
ncbi:aminopeptidase, partial [Thermus scotoductus]|uniref:aminopeptidase n=1 Tax=Thermus scotoductus TaxID=37636 RepID=UPI0020A44897